MVSFSDAEVFEIVTFCYTAVHRKKYMIVSSGVEEGIQTMCRQYLIKVVE